MDILLLIFLLQCKHWYADFGIQTYDQTVKKGLYGDPVGISHSMDHTLWTILALSIFAVFYPVDPVLLLLISLAEGIAHYHIDWFKVKYGNKNPATPRYWQEFGLDQFAHQATYLAIVWSLLV